MQGNFTRFLAPVFELAEKKRTAETAMSASSKSFGSNKGPEGEKDTAVLPVAENKNKKIRIPHEFTPKDYLGFLLHINAEIEHGLMVQYLYAAYSMGGEHVPPQYQDAVRRWQEVILGIAKEEMGHFISCQNVLRLIGAPLNFGREDYPWDTPFYPFPFTLQPLTLDSLAKYVFAESPEGWIDSEDPIAIEIKDKMKQVTHDPHRVGALFEELLLLVGDGKLLPDEVFQSRTYPYQAKFDEWGRGYTGGNRGNSTHGSPPGSPDVLVMPLLSRDDAKKALEAISEQGEATSMAQENAVPSHFERFLSIYTEMRTILAETGNTWLPSRNVATNPYLGSEEEQPEVLKKNRSFNLDYERQVITNPEAIIWAELFNLRYRMLLNYLTHSFQLDDSSDIGGAKTARGAIIAATFGEMYNLRSIANVLVRLPMAVGGDTMAGPPFMMPYTLNLPMGEHNKWLLHADLVQAALRISYQIIAMEASNNHLFLHALIEADKKFLKQVNELTEATEI